MRAVLYMNLSWGARGFLGLVKTLVGDGFGWVVVLLEGGGNWVGFGGGLHVQARSYGVLARKLVHSCVGCVRFGVMVRVQARSYGVLDSKLVHS